jgi:IS5 family transposase
MGVMQLGLDSDVQSTANKLTCREMLLTEIDTVVPWQPLIDLIEPCSPRTGSKGGRPSFPHATMLRIRLLPHRYSLSDPAMEDALIEVPTMRRFAGIAMISERIADETLSTV